MRADQRDDGVMMLKVHSTKQRLLDTGLAMLLEHGYNDLGVQALLDATHIPKGSFYHHFKDKEDFALQVLDQYMRDVHAGLDVSLSDRLRSPLERIRHFFETTQQNYRAQGYMGCLIGGLGQELSGVSEVFRLKVEQCFSQIAARLAVCLEEARQNGDIRKDADVARLRTSWLTAGSAPRSVAGCGVTRPRSAPCSISTSGWSLFADKQRTRIVLTLAVFGGCHPPGSWPSWR